MKKEIKQKNLDEYVIESKYDVIVYLLILIIVVIVILVYVNFINHYYPLAFLLVALLMPIERIETYRNLLKIKKYMQDNKLISKIGKIDFWNERNYMLTENYFFIVKNGKTKHFKYDDIEQIYKKTTYNYGHPVRTKEHLHIILKNREEYKVLIWTLNLVTEEYKDISDYLLEKNNTINFSK